MKLSDTETVELREYTIRKLIEEMRGEGYIDKPGREAIAANLEQQLK
jgi:hypothetical protein